MQKLNLLQHPLPHFNERPVGTAIDTLVIHSMYALGHPDIFSPEACIQILNEHEVSAHYAIARDGQIYTLVPDDKRAWHAGVSKMPISDNPRENVNNFSIGIELIGSMESGFTDRQYQALTELTLNLCSKHPIKFITGHEQISPGRKTDPGSSFDWQKYQALIGLKGESTQSIKFLF